MQTPDLQIKRACECGGRCESCAASSRDLRVSQPDDPYERHADQVADTVMRTPEDGAPASSGHPRVEDDGRIRRKALPASPDASRGPAHVQDAIGAGGKPLDVATRDFFEPRLGHDLSHVRIHADGPASQSARTVHAQAYTLGSHIVFGAGQYRPDSHAGQRLIAHELAHVTQSDAPSGARPDTLYRQPAPADADLAAVELELQQLRMLPVKMPIHQARITELEIMRLKLLASGAGAPRAETRKAQEQTQKPAVAPETPETPDAAYSMRQIDLDLALRTFAGQLRYGGKPDPFAASAETSAPSAAESGCHTDPYAHKTGSTVCGYKRPDEATQATLRAMEEPGIDLSEYYKEQRAELDRLNAAHLDWQQTGLFPQSREFSPYEIRKDRIIPVQVRWDVCNQPHPNNLETAQFDERFFRTEDEYQAEFQRRHQEYEAAVKACGHSRPSHFKCRDKVMATYYPVRFGLYDAAAARTYADMEVAMPVLRHGGPVAGFTFHGAHEWLGWSTERSAAAANFVSGLTNLGAAKLQQVVSSRNAGQSVAPPDEISPPPEHVAPAPERTAVPPPAKQAGSTPGPAADPWARAATPPPVPTPPTVKTDAPKGRRIVVAVDPRPPAPAVDPNATRKGPLSPAEERLRVLANKDVYVGVQANIKMTGAPAEGLKGAAFGDLDATRSKALGGTGRAAVLPEVSQPPGTPAKKGSQPSAGLVAEPARGATGIEVAAWNTGAPEKGANVSHAERQVIEWFRSQDPKWIERVTSVDVQVFGREICTLCDADIKALQEAYPHVKFNWVRADTGRPLKPPRAPR